METVARMELNVGPDVPPTALLPIRVLCGEVSVPVELSSSVDSLKPGTVALLPAGAASPTASAALVSGPPAVALLYLCHAYDALAPLLPSRAPSSEVFSAALTRAVTELPAAVSRACETGADPTGSACPPALEDAVGAIADDAEPWLGTTCGGSSFTLLDVVCGCVFSPWVARGGTPPPTVVAARQTASRYLRVWDHVTSGLERDVRRSLGLLGAAVVDAADDGLCPWLANVSPSNPVRPLDLLRLAGVVGIDVAVEPRLLWVLHTVFTLPLPPSWQKVHDVGGPGTTSGDPGRSGGYIGGRVVRVLFLNRMTGRTTYAHPGLEYVQEQVAAARRRAQLLVNRGADMGDVLGSRGCGGSWMCFSATDAEFEALSSALPAAPTPAPPGAGAGMGGYGGTQPPPSTAPSSRAASRGATPEPIPEHRESPPPALGGASHVGDSKGGGEDATAGDGPDSDADVGDADSRVSGGRRQQYYFDFESRQVSLFLPRGCRLLPKPPTDAALHGQLMTSALPRSPTAKSRARPRAAAGGAAASAESPVRSSAAASGASPTFEPITLRFKSWWNEVETVARTEAHSSVFRRQTLLVVFTVEDGSCEVALEGDNKTYVLPYIEDKRRGRLECWDLFVGATVHLMGRRTTLKQASVATINWMEHHAARLARVVAQLRKELGKYAPHHAAMREPRRKPQGKAAGSCNLRAMLEEVDKLRRALSEFRPKVADKLLQGLFATTVPPSPPR